MTRPLALLGAALLVVLALAATAAAHVTVHPNAVPAGGFTTLAIRVPNERDRAATTKLSVRFPPGFSSMSYEAVPGWTVKVTYRKLARPVRSSGQRVAQEVDVVTWTGHGLQGRIAPGQFAEFPISVAVPARKAGSLLTFKAVQTYSDGDVERWIGPPGADEPAPQVLVTPKGSPVRDYPAGVAAAKRDKGLMHGSASVLVPALGLLGLARTVTRRRRPAERDEEWSQRDSNP